MALVKANRTALLTMSALLAGCATFGPRTETTALTPKGQIATKADAAETLAAGAEPSIDFDGALLKAQTQRKMGDLAGASRTLSQMVLIAPDDPRVLGEYGKTLVAQGRSDDALAFLERAIELQTGDWTLYSAQGVAYDQKSDFRAAQTAYARALALKPGEPVVLSNKALSHIQSGDLDEAERLLRAAAASGGDSPRIASNLALVQSLRNTRRPAAPAPVPEDPAEKIAETPAQPFSPPPVAEVPAQPPAVIVKAPEESAPFTAVIPEPVHSAEIPAPQPQESTTALRQTNTEPVVRRQTVPVDPLAGPAASKKTAPAKTAAAKPQAKPSDNATAAFLRPSLSVAQQAGNRQ